jgi:hypothetical protein
MPLHRGRSAGWIVKRRFYELNANGQRRYLESWHTISTHHYKDQAIKRAEDEQQLHPGPSGFEVAVFYRGRRVWPVEVVRIVLKSARSNRA